MEKGKQRRSILVGCNYPNTKNELHGCINDVVDMKEVLIERFRFEPSGIELLTDAPRPVSNSVMPTGANIKAALKRMVDGAEAGDVLFFHYNGHGTRIPSMKPRRPFRQDEAIVPTYFNLFTDLDFRQLVNRLPKGTKLHNSIIFMPQAHSGGLIDEEKKQIGPSSSIIENNDKNCFSTPKPLVECLKHYKPLGFN